jgi:FkbM family methyltransferase
MAMKDLRAAEFVSFSHNFEDVMLRRVFADMPRGYYIDVGASWPTISSNTYGLYQSGWRGIVVDPLIKLSQMHADAWAHNRPEDQQVHAVLGAEVGEATLYCCNMLQMSTLNADVVASWPQDLKLLQQISAVPQGTLDDIWARWQLDRVDLLCIDVEGTEQQVMDGLDCRYHRPRLIVIESMWPGSAIPVDSLLEYFSNRNYALVYEDGANQWYLARECWELKSRFRYPPGFMDNFITWKQAHCEGKIPAALVEEGASPLAA